METDINAKYGEGLPHRVEAIFRRQADMKKADKNLSMASTLCEVEKFTDLFNMKQKSIENQLQTLKSMDPNDQESLSNQISNINTDIQELWKLYSNATLIMRLYDKKVFQASLQGLQTKLQNLENKLLPKKKFGFKVKKNNFERTELKIPDMDVKDAVHNDLSINFVGISGKSNEDLTLEGEHIRNRDLLLKDLKNCHIYLKGVPTTVHATNIDSCSFFFGPVTTSVFLENVTDSVVNLACQQLRIHDTTNTDCYVHVTSKSVIENCKNIRFGIYSYTYEGIEDDYQTSGLDKQVNNWDQVDDFNWLVTNKPSPNWSKLT